VPIKVTCSENGDSPGIADGLIKRGEELEILSTEDGKRNGVNQQLCFVWGGFEEIPRAFAHQEDLFQPGSNGSEVGGVSGGWGVKVGAEK